jgi:capsular polysaccharide biosynthesis protein
VQETWSSNYGHWMVEMLPRAIISTRMLGQRLHVVVHRTDSGLDNVVDRCLTLAGYDRSHCVRHGMEAHFYHELVVIVGLTRHGSFMSPLTLDALAQLDPQPSMAGTDHGRRGKERIFLSRLGSAGRQIANQKELLPLLDRFDISVVCPGNLSIDDQIDMFRSAWLIVGSMGAELTNTAFCRPGAQIVALTPQAMPDTFFWFIAQIRSLNYMEIRSPTERPLEGRSWNRSFSVDPQDLAPALEAIDTGSRGG